MFKTFLSALSTLTLLFLITPVAAHAHMLGGSGFSSGSIHPFVGIDHLLAMIAVGIIAVQRGGKALMLIPATFILFMVAGGVAGISSVNLPFVEFGIAFSVLFLGSIIVLAKKIRASLVFAAVVLFAIFHGHAHGTEMAAVQNPAFYILGLVLSTTLLHISGVLMGLYAKRTIVSLQLTKITGLATSLAGFYLLFGR